MGTIDTSLLSADLVFLDMEANDRKEFFTNLYDRLHERGLVKESWLGAIQEREKDYPTGLECTAISVALPHVDPQHLLRPYIAVIKPSQPIEFVGMADTGMVQAELIVNLGIMAHEDEQVGVLQAFLNIFIDEDASADIMAQKTEQGIINAIVSRCN